MSKKITDKTALRRITRELRELFENPLPGIMIDVKDDDMSKVNAMIMGPKDTPYEGGFFYFKIQFPTNYPAKPPHVDFMTTGGGRVRFNPNLYKDGKVCLSLLGTWSGPGWTPAQTLSSVLLALQAQVMNDKPICNEPCFSEEKKKEYIDGYNDCIIHETYRVAVCDFLENKTGAPEIFVETARSIFPTICDKIIKDCKERIHDIGEHTCDFCLNNKNSSIPYRDKKSLYKICRKCYNITTVVSSTCIVSSTNIHKICRKCNTVSSSTGIVIVVSSTGTFSFSSATSKNSSDDKKNSCKVNFEKSQDFSGQNNLVFDHESVYKRLVQLKKELDVSKNS